MQISILIALFSFFTDTMYVCAVISLYIVFESDGHLIYISLPKQTYVRIIKRNTKAQQHRRPIIQRIML